MIISLSHLAKELEQLGSDPNSTLWDALRLITAEFAEAAEKADKADMPFEAHYARIAADAIADASTFVEPEPKVVSVKTATEEENGYKLANLRVALNADANAKWAECDKDVMKAAAFYPLTNPNSAVYHPPFVHNTVYMPLLQGYDYSNLWLDKNKQGG